MKQHLRLIFSVSSVLALGMSLVGCSGAVVIPSPTDPSSIASSASSASITGAWKLQSLTRSNSTTRVSDPNLFTVEFRDGNALSARTDCNRAAGSYKTDGSRLTIGPMAMTKAYCSSAPFDDDYVSLLSGENVVNATATSLTLSSSRGTLQFGR